MILQALCGYYQRASAMPGADIIAPGYALSGVTAEIVLAPDGAIAAVNNLQVQQGKKWAPRQIIVPLAPKRAGSRPEAAFLYETVAFLFGIFDKPDGAAYRFEASGQKHHDILDGVDDEGARAVLAFFDRRTRGDTRQEGVDTSLLDDPRVFAVFRLQGDSCFLHERHAIRDAWDAYNAGKTGEAEMVQCLVTGETAPLARLHGNVSGFGADKPTLVGFNQDSFCSYGKSQGANAPVGERAAFEYVTALNLLIRDRRHTVNLAGDKVLFWAERDAVLEESLIMIAMDGADREGGAIAELDTTQQERIRGIWESIYAGGDPSAFGLDPSVRFYMLGVSANKTRLVIRFFHQSTFGELLANLTRHFGDIAVDGMRFRFPSPYFILVEMALERKRDNVPDSVDAALMRSILDGTPYPWPLYQGVLRRIRAEGEVTPLRVGIIKGTINRLAQREALKMALDPNERNVPYLLGRLFAYLELAQYHALGEVNAGIDDKYFNSALASPQTVFPSLLALNKKHVAKANDQGVAGKIQEIISMLELCQEGPNKALFPSSLNAIGQGNFIGGYYHQKQAFRQKNKGADSAPHADDEPGAEE